MLSYIDKQTKAQYTNRNKKHDGRQNFSTFFRQINETKQKHMIVYENKSYNIKWNVNKIIPFEQKKTRFE